MIKGILIFSIIYFTAVYGKNDCVKKRDLVIHVPTKQTEETILECRGTTYFKQYGYVYWIIGDNMLVNQADKNHYSENLQIPTKKTDCYNLPEAYLTLKNITEEMKHTKISCVLVDLKTPLKETIILQNIWDCFNTSSYSLP
ncbi:IL-18 binding protein [Deerpox virus W-848-83]|uniref:IL-18 binding protein n=1 Tax=Deerpox virus (strain Mule deer/United States/W-848-83/1983) TaxID=305674 RepID=Q08FX9_DPV83|nr:IL-18 binding protein [Deerpox virus W-848-83]ABI99178.1 IL-18 binding protein [Deerpox virus W-848-83]